MFWVILNVSILLLFFKKILNNYSDKHKNSFLVILILSKINPPKNHKEFIAIHIQESFIVIFKCLSIYS